MQIDDPELSRRHAWVRPMGDGVEIEDLGSTNGTFVNGRRIQGAATISPGAVIRMGQTTLELERVSAPTMESPAVAASAPSAEREPSTSELPTSLPPGHRPLTVHKESRRPWVLAVAVVLVLLVAGAAYTVFFRETSRAEYVAASGEVCKQTSQRVTRVTLKSNAPFGARANAAARAHEDLRAAFVDIRGLERPQKGRRKLIVFLTRFRDLNAKLDAYRRSLARASGPIEVKAGSRSAERRRRLAILRRRRSSTNHARQDFVGAADRSSAAARAARISACANLIELSRKRVT